MSDAALVNTALEHKINTARKLTSLVLSIRKKENLKVRQPLARVLVPALNQQDAEVLESIQNILLAEVNVKALEIIAPDAGVFVKGKAKLQGPRSESWASHESSESLHRRDGKYGH